MKLVKYTLTEFGSIPNCIVDGGYFPTPSGNVSPQDLTMLGIAIDECTNEKITSKTALKSYLNSISEGWLEADGTPFDSTKQSDFLWAKLST
jgi:hypothetical protein